MVCLTASARGLGCRDSREGFLGTKIEIVVRGRVVRGLGGVDALEGWEVGFVYKSIVSFVSI